MLKPRDKENLEKAQQAVDLAQQAIKDIIKAEDPLLAELGLEMMEHISKLNQKLQRLLVLTK